VYTIGRLARRAKVNPDSIRFYERQGLLSPETKTDAGYRLYTDDAVRRIAFIKHAQRCGFSLAEISALLNVHSDDPAARVNGYQLAEQKQIEIEDTIEALRAMSEALSCLLDARADESAKAPVRFEDGALMNALRVA
jgi:MerR family Zn(II)-responsive transcriptional regulator of zntA